MTYRPVAWTHAIQATGPSVILVALAQGRENTNEQWHHQWEQNSDTTVVTTQEMKLTSTVTSPDSEIIFHVNQSRK